MWKLLHVLEWNSKKCLYSLNSFQNWKFALRVCNENAFVRLVTLFLKIVLNNSLFCYDASYKIMVGKLM